MSRAPQEDPRQDTPAISAPTRSAAGIPAVINSLRVVSRQSGAARGLATLRDVNQKTGFDCPGCAWPEGKRRHLAEFCENGAKAVAEEATRRAVTPEFFARYSVAELSTRSGYWLGQQGRLTHPVFLDKGATHYVPVSWERAFSLIAEELAALDSPDEAVFYTSGRTRNEAAFLYQLIARKLGTNNLPGCSNMCHQSCGVARTEARGVAQRSALPADPNQADLIIVAGQNPGTNHPRMLSALEKAKRGGTRIITVNPLPEVGLMRFKNPQKARGIVGGGTRLTDLFLQIRLGGDLALFRAWNRMLVEADRDNSGSVLDREFIAEHTHGFDAFVHELCADSDEKFWADVDTATGLPREQITEALEMIQASKRIVVCWAMGLTQHKHSVPTIREVVNFLLLRGNVGRPGAGVCP